ncbi:Uncharacterised protein [Klebsiella pneumoniae]|nr:Uncharacterised protein [Klebsiella pneumoniae]
MRLGEPGHFAANVRDIQRRSTDIDNQQGVQIVQILQHTEACRDRLWQHTDFTHGKALMPLNGHRAFHVRFFPLDFGHIRLIVLIQILAQRQRHNNVNRLRFNAGLHQRVVDSDYIHITVLIAGFRGAHGIRAQLVKAVLFPVNFIVGGSRPR